MDLLSFYKPLPRNQFHLHLSQQKDHILNPLSVTTFEAKKVLRLLKGRLKNKNLTFMQNYLNPQKEFEQSEDEIQQEDLSIAKKKFNIEDHLNFSLITKSQLQDYEIFVKFQINLRRAAFCFESKIMKNYKIVKVESKSLIRFIGKYFISYNGKLKEGSFFVNPMTSQISFFINNYSTLDGISSLMRNPQKFLSFVIFQVEQITIKWNQCLDSILYLINKKLYDQINPSKKLKYVKGKITKLSQMVIHSHIDALFFSDQRIPRFKKISDDERKEKIFQNNKRLNEMEKRNKDLTYFFRFMQKFMSRKKINQCLFVFPKWQMQNMKETAPNLACNEYSGKFPIYSEIQILNVDSQVCIFQSGFSKIYILDALFKRDSEGQTSKGPLIKKQTQQKRYKNQVEILKLLHNAKCWFFPRYYFCQQEEYKKSIFVEYIPESSIDRYLMTKLLFIGNETKLFFLFEIVIALRFLRDNSIVHIDLKPENVLIKIVGDMRQNVHYLVKIIDFGESYSSKIDQISSDSNSRGFTIPYAPPQLLSKCSKFDEKTDVYSFGVIMYKIMFNHFPIEIMKLKKMEFIEEQYLKFYSLPFEKLQNFGIHQISLLMYYLCLKCLQPDPNDRPTLDWLCIILKDLVLLYEELTK